MPTAGQQGVAAVVVLYRPSSDVVSNVSAFAGQVDRVFAVDNSEAPDAAVVESLRRISNLEYVPLGDNLGVATALNIGARHALGAGYEWLLTMDQDSAATPGMVSKMLELRSRRPGPDNDRHLDARAPPGRRDPPRIERRLQASTLHHDFGEPASADCLGGRGGVHGRSLHRPG